MGRALARRSPNLTWVIGLALVGLIVWLVMRNRGASIGQYRNTKSWEITYNEDGMPIKIVKHVNARME